MTYQWECKYCGLKQLWSNKNRSFFSDELNVGECNIGFPSFEAIATRCLSDGCNKVSFSMVIFAGEKVEGGTRTNKTGVVKDWELLPEAAIQPQPDYIHESIRQDYYEACLIKTKSPKASATLARRCIQGMIRDFCSISEKTLNQEITKLKKAFEAGTAPRAVSDESIEAIDKVRQIGNIGAHMERDISVIVDVDPEEAQVLINLIELLFAEWYVAREKRRVRLAELSRIAEEKQAQRANPPSS